MKFLKYVTISTMLGLGIGCDNTSQVSKLKIPIENISVEDLEELISANISYSRKNPWKLLCYGNSTFYNLLNTI